MAGRRQPGIRVVKDTATPVLNATARRVKNPRPTLKKVGRYVTEISKHSFRKSIDPETRRRWDKLDPATIKARRKKGRGAKILIDFKHLSRSITSILTGAKSVAIGTALKYGLFHQFGYGVPRRSFLGLHKQDMAELEKLVLKWTFPEVAK